MNALAAESSALEIRIRGLVQGVGFRPTLWRIARELGLAGEVFNDSEGVLLRVGGDQAQLTVFLDQVKLRLPPLARVESMETRVYAGPLPREFRIAESSGGEARTQIGPDVAICAACAGELRDEGDRHYRYPFTSCTHCGPRLSIVTAIPYDRAATTMAPFTLCRDCRAEYADPRDRRFHAEAIACPRCGPTATLVALQSPERRDESAVDDVERAADLIRGGAIVAIKGIGGYHLACEAENAGAVARLRRLKRRPAKPFALMARDVEAISRYCSMNAEERRQLTGAQAPIVLLRADGPQRLPDEVAPGLDTLGFMLPTTPLHLLLLQNMDGPLIMTSGNLAEEPPIIDDAEAGATLSAVASYALVHDREIANRVDDSVVRVMGGKSRTLRRARGLAPSPIKLPSGFARAPELLAMGGELKATFCLLKDGQAVLSQHQGDLENAATFDDYRKNLTLYRRLFAHDPAAVVVDMHPEYLSSKLARAQARELGVGVLEVQHHHAHVASCLAENGYTLGRPAVLGIVLDGLGLGDDGTIWGGEFLLADYRTYRRLARLKPVAMPGAAQAVREPWRNLYAHLKDALGWTALTSRFSGLDLHGYLEGKPRAVLDAMIEKGINAPPASSCGRLFDAVAAALGLCRERQNYEGEAALRLEALAETARCQSEEATKAYPFAVFGPADGLIEIDPAPMWRELLSDLADGVAASTIALKFHDGLSLALVETATRLARRPGLPLFETVALSGGCFQNNILFESVTARLRREGFAVLTHAEVPANDGGLSLGQAAIGAARLLEGANNNAKGKRPCVSAFQAASSE